MECIMEDDGRCATRFINRLIEEMQKNQEAWSGILDHALEAKKMEDLPRGSGDDWKIAKDTFPNLSLPTMEQIIDDFLEQYLGQRDAELAQKIANAVRPIAMRELGILPAYEDLEPVDRFAAATAKVAGVGEGSKANDV
jgi:hypothetical protein